MAKLSQTPQCFCVTEIGIETKEVVVTDKIGREHVRLKCTACGTLASQSIPNRGAGVNNEKIKEIRFV